MIFLFDESFSIYGGNVKSTMAGEFSFSIALSFAILGLGVFARGLETGKYRSWAAILIALAMLCHGIVAIFVVVGAVLLWLVWMDKHPVQSTGRRCSAGAVLLSAFWVVPFLANHAYMTDMKYDGPARRRRHDSYWDMFFPWPTFLDILVTGFAIIGFIAVRGPTPPHRRVAGHLLPRARRRRLPGQATACRSSACCGTRASCRSCTCCGCC